mmetsp:Transcript_19180/g.53589  ORF Transcript_19180/g.53589 Transcript_19180/m.53589 type:complete len:230 (+) Transcript_19180:221-910(+)
MCTDSPQPALAESSAGFMPSCFASSRMYHVLMALSTSVILPSSPLEMSSGSSRRGSPFTLMKPRSKSQHQSTGYEPSRRASPTVFAFEYFSYRKWLFEPGDLACGRYSMGVSAIQRVMCSYVSSLNCMWPLSPFMWSGKGHFSSIPSWCFTNCSRVIVVAALIKPLSTLPRWNNASLLVDDAAFFVMVFLTFVAEPFGLPLAFAFPFAGTFEGPMAPVPLRSWERWLRG